jgi:hypothetical protein
MRAGSVLMNNPIISSIPAGPSDRPDTVAPNKTSSSPLYRLSKIAHAPWISVLIVNWRRRANACAAAVRATLNFTSIFG